MRGELIRAEKAGLRKLAGMRRAALSPAAREAAGRRVAAHFLARVPLRPSDIVAAYWPIREELACRPLVDALRARGHTICLPVTREGSPLVMRLWAEGAGLAPAGFGTMAPGPSAAELEPDVVLLPLVGFDARGTRLGYGKGHYDRWLSGLSRPPLLVGLGFACQEVPTIPLEPHDVPLDLVVTEKGVLSFAGAPA